MLMIIPANIPPIVLKDERDCLSSGSAEMALAIEPMVIDGSGKIFVDSDNKWTVYTDDEALAAHYENTVIMVDGEPVITTLVK